MTSRFCSVQQLLGQAWSLLMVTRMMIMMMSGFGLVASSQEMVAAETREVNKLIPPLPGLLRDQPEKLWDHEDQAVAAHALVKPDPNGAMGNGQQYWPQGSGYQQQPGEGLLDTLLKSKAFYCDDGFLAAEHPLQPCQNSRSRVAGDQYDAGTMNSGISMRARNDINGLSNGGQIASDERATGETNFANTGLAKTTEMEKWMNAAQLSKQETEVATTRAKRLRDMGDIQRTLYILKERRRANEMRKLALVIQHLLEWNVLQPEDLYLFKH